MMNELTRLVKDEGFRLGFSHVGIARAEGLEAEGACLSAWLSRGYQGTMAWMERTAEKRSDPRKVLESVRSVISVSYNYYVGGAHSPDPGRGKISRYAWGEDYHDILDRKLDELQDFILLHRPGAACWSSVDTGPAMDKAWAVRAGIGWLGKHTNVITRDLGSWVFLGVVFTDCELVPDQPMADFCGSCTACMDACPTGAIVQPYVVDGSRCISYLTIEHKGEIDTAFHAHMDNWVFGCDICQDVCPWNRFQRESQEIRFRPGPEGVSPRIEELVKLSQEEFSRRYSKSPVRRAKLEGLRRNARAVESGQRDVSRSTP